MTALPRLRLAVSALALTAFAALAARPAPPVTAAEEKAKAPAKLTVLVPPDPSYRAVVLKLQGVAVAETGTRRVLRTRALEPGKEYTFKLEATIVPNNYTTITRRRTVTVKAGDSVTVDMRKDDKKSPDQVVIRWVPTPRDIAQQMCKLAKIGKDDVVCDPGCGNAIMIITAVKDFGAKKGIGIDIDPDKVKDAKEAAKEAGVDDRVKIKRGDALKLKKSDIGEASVVMLYMGNELNIRLRPALWKYLKPGSRVVSHRFIMGDWKPDRTIRVTGRDGDEYILHLWTITGKEGATVGKKE
jgi:uncharacterized protein (TIGR03000 family)